MIEISLQYDHEDKNQERAREKKGAVVSRRGESFVARGSETLVNQTPQPQLKVILDIAQIGWVLAGEFL